MACRPCRARTSNGPIPDILADPEYTYGSKAIETFRTVLGVPILKGEEVFGVILVYHLGEVQPFTDKQIALVETFADQAAIASRTFGYWTNCVSAPTI